MLAALSWGSQAVSAACPWLLLTQWHCRCLFPLLPARVSGTGQAALVQMLLYVIPGMSGMLWCACVRRPLLTKRTGVGSCGSTAHEHVGVYVLEMPFGVCIVPSLSCTITAFTSGTCMVPRSSMVLRWGRFLLPTAGEGQAGWCRGLRGPCELSVALQVAAGNVGAEVSCPLGPSLPGGRGGVLQLGSAPYREHRAWPAQSVDLTFPFPCITIRAPVPPQHRTVHAVTPVDAGSLEVQGGRQALKQDFGMASQGGQLLLWQACPRVLGRHKKV